MRAERCALPLRARLGAAGVVLPAGLRAPLDAQATFETKRFLSVAAQLRTVGAELGRRGWPGVALKGGGAAADGGEPLDVQDLDLLLEGERAREFAGVLERQAGYRAGFADPGPSLTGGWELAPRVAEGSVQVEIHYDVPHLGEGVSVWEGIRPTRVAGIFALAPATHLWHLLVHAVVHHVERRGQVRELLLLRAAMDACSPGELALARARVDGHPAAAALRASWELAGALGSGREPADPFRGVAAARLALAAGAGRRLPDALRSLSFAPSAYALAAGGGEYARLWYGTRASVLPAQGYRGGTWLDGRLPAAALGVRVVSRAARLAAGFAPAWRLHRGLRALLGPDPGSEPR